MTYNVMIVLDNGLAPIMFFRYQAQFREMVQLAEQYAKPRISVKHIKDLLNAPSKELLRIYYVNMIGIFAFNLILAEYDT